MLSVLCITGISWGVCRQAAIPDGPTAAKHCLSYLARHQSEDGSWGKRPKSCTCALPVLGLEGLKGAAPENAEATRLVESLGSDNDKTRRLSQERLEVLGTQALPALANGLSNSDAEIRGRCRQVLDAITRSRETPSVRATSLALLSFLAQGYGPTSEEHLESIRIGDVVKKGLKWILSKQNDDGGFDGEDPGADALASLAVAEAYLQTGTHPLQYGLERAVDQLKLMKATGPDIRTYRAMAFDSAVKSKICKQLPIELEAETIPLIGRTDLESQIGLAYLQTLKGHQLSTELAQQLRAVHLLALRQENLSMALSPLFSERVWSVVAHPDDRVAFREAIWASQRKDRECERGSWGEGEYKVILERSASISTLLISAGAAGSYEYK